MKNIFNLNFDIAFPLEHKRFYEALAAWRSAINPDDYSNCVYVLVYNRPVERFLKKDDHGVLYIGKGSLTPNRERIGEFINSLNGRSDQHGAGVLYCSNHAISDKFPLEKLKLHCYFTKDAREVEKELLGLYLKEFGEYPPFNHIG